MIYEKPFVDSVVPVVKSNRNSPQESLTYDAEVMVRGIGNFTVKADLPDRFSAQTEAADTAALLRLRLELHTKEWLEARGLKPAKP